MYFFHRIQLLRFIQTKERTKFDNKCNDLEKWRLKRQIIIFNHQAILYVDTYYGFDLTILKYLTINLF